MNELPEVKLLRSDGQPTSNETKFGGKPLLIQCDHVPECCEHEMLLLIQLDGLDFQEAKLPDSGLVQVFICQKCKQVHASLECC